MRHVLCPPSSSPMLPILFSLTLLTGGCSSPAREAGAAAPPIEAASKPVSNEAGGSGAQWLTKLAEAAASDSRSLPDGVVAEGDCTILYPPPDEEIEAQARATVPLKAGLTLSNLWRRVDAPDDVECLLHIQDVGAEAIVSSTSCIQRGGDVSSVRRTCRADLRRARVYYTETGSGSPETIVGATSYSLSREAFLELKQGRPTRHRYLELRGDGSSVEVDLDGTLTLDGTGVLATLVNDEPAELPVLHLSGRLRGVVSLSGDKPAETRVTAAVLDDERFPLVLDYRMPDLGSQEFSLRYTKISYPTGSGIETRLEKEKRVDVYGIYFDFGSDRIRVESEPVLKEIGDALQRNADWRVSIEGHTDSIGTDHDNLELSQRRSAAVRAALVDRYGVAPERLSTAGYGEGSPKDTNDTPEGRARNRRVELVRR